MAGQKTQYLRADVAAARLADVPFKQGQPVLLVASLGGGQRQQDVTLRAGAALRQIAVDAGFGALVGQVLPPAPKVGCGRLSPVGISIASVVRHPTMVGFTPGNAAHVLEESAFTPW